MADNITETITIAIQNPDGVTHAINEYSAQKFDMDSTYKSAQKTIQSITNTYEAISGTDIDTTGEYAVFLKNLKTTNVNMLISLDGGSTDSGMEVPYGEACLLKIKDQALPQIKMASAGATDILVLVWEKITPP